MTRALAIVGLAAGLILQTGCGITASSRNPGFADVDIPRSKDLRRDTSISIGPALLGLAARHADEDPQTMALLAALDGVRVKVYRVDEAADIAALGDALNRSAAQLRKHDWQPIVRVLEDDSTVHMFIKEHDEHLVGLAFITADREEYVFVNIMGRLTSDLIDQLSASSTEVLALGSGPTP